METDLTSMHVDIRDIHKALLKFALFLYLQKPDLSCMILVTHWVCAGLLRGPYLEYPMYTQYWVVTNTWTWPPFTIYAITCLCSLLGFNPMKV